MKPLFYVFAFLISMQSIFSQTFDTQKLDAYFKTLEINNKFMGSVTLFKEGKIIYTNQTGFSDMENNIKPDENTKYRIGSISKTFTAILILKAVEEGKIDLFETIETYFPKLSNSKKITIENLLYHRSGVQNFTNKAYLNYNTTYKSEAELISIISGFSSDFKPDTKSEYSNSNYVLLSIILQGIYKKSFAEILKDKIITPLQLKNTYFGSEISIKKNEAYSYLYLQNWQKSNETNTSIPLGAGGIISSAKDLVLFANALFNYKIISEASVLKMKTIKGKYGMGLFKLPFYTKYAFGHGGKIDGFTANFGYFTEDKIGFAWLSNGSNYENNNVSIAMLSSVFNKSYTIPSFESYTHTVKDLEQFVGIYATTGFPLKITISIQNKTLIAQATGQASFPLEATEKHTFTFDTATIKMIFNPKNNSMKFSQGNASFIFKKE